MFFFFQAMRIDDSFSRRQTYFLTFLFSCENRPKPPCASAINPEKANSLRIIEKRRLIWKVQIQILAEHKNILPKKQDKLARLEPGSAPGDFAIIKTPPTATSLTKQIAIERWIVPLQNNYWSILQYSFWSGAQRGPFHEKWKPTRISKIGEYHV